MRYGSVCSGIEAATVAWHGLGWKPSFFSEIEKFPRDVLAHHYPETPLHGDFTTIKKDDYEPIKLLVGGTPCQSFSVAGLREGLNDPRGNLMLEFGALADRLQPKWLVWENVPGVLSSNGGRDFASFLGMLGQLGYGFAYRVLDAQYFGVPQRRRRVFVIGCLGDWRSAAAVLFERHSLQWHSAPSRGERKEVTEIAGTLTSNGGGLNRPAGNANELDFCVTVAHVFKVRGGCEGGGKGYLGQDEQAFTVSTGQDHHLMTPAMQVRRLTPMECERLQGFPDNYTNIPGASDSPRYKALGNSMAVPVMKWLGERIQMVEANA
jgi:DNA (cytosine-5)-methyltransferase 1